MKALYKLYIQILLRKLPSFLSICRFILKIYEKTGKKKKDKYSYYKEIIVWNIILQASRKKLPFRKS